MPPRKRTDWLQIGSGKSYAHRVHQPLQCLIFVLPLLLIYQVGSVLHPWMVAQGAGAGPNAPVYSPHVVAFVLMLKFFALFGAVGSILPPLAVVAILFFWHLARKDPWEFDFNLYMGMLAESVLWAIPIFVIGLAVTRHAGSPSPGWARLAAGTGGSTLPWQTEAVLSIGAGIYEELLFRLIAITLLNIILVDIFELKIQTAIPIIVLTSAILFAAYHYLGTEHFNTATFFFRTAMGVYLAGIYIYRGFGVTVGTHATYDLIVVAFTHWH